MPTSKGNRLVLAMAIALSSPTYGASNMVPTPSPQCGEFLGKALETPPAVLEPLEPVADPGRQAEFENLAAQLNYLATIQQKQFVNTNRERTIILKGKRAFAMLKAFHGSGKSKRYHHALVEESLDFISSGLGPDPKNPKKTARIHIFKKEIDSQRAVFAILVEREAAGQGPRLDELFVRLAMKNKSTVALVDFPLVYQAYGRYRKLNRNLEVEDRGLSHIYNAKLRVFTENGDELSSGIQAEIFASSIRPAPEGAIKVKISVVK